MQTPDIQLTKAQALSVGIALRHYLQQFDAETIRTAHPESCIGKCLLVYNRIENQQHGSHLEWNVNRVPAWAASLPC